MIFQARSENTNNIREIICKFNLITYGGLILMYPLLIFTNLSSFFFIIVSLIMLPQIYTNAMQGQRPNISSPYYSKFLTYRFLLIVIIVLFSCISNASHGIFSTSNPITFSALVVLLFWLSKYLFLYSDTFIMDTEAVWTEESFSQIFVASCIQLWLLGNLNEY